MKWRNSAGLTIAVLALLGFSAQPIARWLVSQTISQYIPGGKAFAGSVSWDPVRHTWTCNQLEMKIDGLDAFRAARGTIQLDAKALMNRNLLIESARVDGVVIPIPKKSLGARLHDHSPTMTFASFELENWLDARLQQYKGQILSEVQRHERRHADLRNELDRLQSRCERNQADASANPLRSRGDIQEARRELANFLQSLAEERIRMRETDRELANASLRFRDAWREDLAQAIVHSLPERTPWIEEIAEKCLARYWESRRLLLRCASATAWPLERRESMLRGKEVDIPGMPNHYAQVRSASLAGYLDVEEEKPTRFRATVNHWSDARHTGESKADWYFELPGIDDPKAIRVHVEGIGIRKEFALTWTEQSDQKRDCRGHWQSHPDGDRFELTLPIDCIALDALRGQKDWESSWCSAIESHRGRHLCASLPLLDGNAVGIADAWRCDRPEISPESLDLLSQVWDQTLAMVLESHVGRIQSRLGGLIRAMEQFRNLYWSTDKQTRLDAIAKLEREAVSLRNRWDEYDKRGDRVADLRATGDDY